MIGIGISPMFLDGAVGNYAKLFSEAFTGVPLLFSANPVNDTVGCGIRQVIQVVDTYHLFEETLNATNPIWTIEKRTSLDGLNWSAKSTPLLVAGAGGTYDELGQADPTVIYEGPGDWKMWYDAKRVASPVWQGLGYATSVDGINWIKYGSVITIGAAGQWDSGFIHHPAVVKVGSTYYMFYSAHNAPTPYAIGLATSSDGINWTKQATNPIITVGTAGQFDSNYIRPSAPIKIYDTWYMWYWGFDGTNHSMGLATSPDLIAWTKKGKVIGNPVGTFGEVNPVSTGVMLKSGSNPKDKIVQIWYNTYNTGDLYSLCYANAAVPQVGTKIAPFTVTELKKFGDTYGGRTSAGHAANYIYLHKVTITSTMTPEALKVYLPALNVSGVVKMALYSNLADTPKDLLAVTNEVSWIKTNNKMWNRFYFVTPPTLAIGDYWVAIWSSVNWNKGRSIGGLNNWGNTPLTYTGTFPNPITATTNQAFSGSDIYLVQFATPNTSKIWDINQIEPTNVYFNTVKGTRVSSRAACAGEYNWFWGAGVLSIYSAENPDVRYQIFYD